MTTHTYTIMPDAKTHTCWDLPEWDGTLNPEHCEGCQEASQHPCFYCGYGEVFTTHNDLAHGEGGDTLCDGTMQWYNAPHIYEEDN